MWFFGPIFFFFFFFLTRVKTYFWTKITKNLQTSSKDMYLGNIFSLFWLISYFWKFWHFSCKNWNFGQKVLFLAFLVKIFKNRKLIKKVRCILTALANFWWFLSKNIFFTIVKKVRAKKSLFWWFLKNTIFSQNLTI